ncbi:MAG: hypothetical protein AAFY22_08580 [Pseudomonadota bacterium]
MTPAVLKKPTPQIWLAMGEQFHQDWSIVSGANKGGSLQEAFRKTFSDFSDSEILQLKNLIRELLENSKATGDLKRAWKLAETDFLAPKNPFDWYTQILSALDSLKSGRASA